MTKLHEVLAVEASKQEIAHKIVAESVKTFNTHALFQGFEKILKMEEDGQELTEAGGYESRELGTTVPKRLDYTAAALIDWFDVVLQKEKTNQTATESIIVDGVTIATDIPVTFLLGLETKLKNLHKMYDTVPTLPPALNWMPSEQDGEDVYQLQSAEVKIKTAKTMVHKVLQEATDKHPAQIEKWNEDKPVGKYTTTYKVGFITSARKHTLLKRLDNLGQAVKQARMRANAIDVVDAKIGEVIFGFLHA